ncbi:ABC transporter ATP-binding protein [Adhaeribacter radiodurans]|uniref:ABC transporter ATP-binding protein n=1 Tax=Adhaeribacter radiodurans TaxID=2745197 RepID=A0A7L7LEH1_9BACT|nr:ABC transporter ATP-binding protein [Adhaeribacter radiodurans]QMU31262.1 ABC transporter ATP-binding protein [Adhaeribacter radiodurans]
MKESTFSLLKRTFVQARPYWAYIAGIFICNFLASPIALLKPLALKILIDNGFGSRPLPGFITYFFPVNYEFSFTSIVWISVALVLLIALIDNIYTVIIWILNTYTGEKLVRNFKYLLFNQVQRLSLAFHDRNGTADSVYRIQYDTSAIRTLIIGNLSPILTSCITLVGMIVIMFTINSRFALITCSIIPPMIFLTRISTKKLKKDWKKVKEYESNAMSVVQEVLTSLRVVKAFGQEEGESNRFMAKADIAMKGQLKVAWIGALFYFCIGMIYAAGTALFIYFGASYVRSGEMTLGELTMVIAYLGQIYGPLDKISRNLNEVQSSLTSIERVYTLLDEQREVKETANPVHLARTKGVIEFQNVGFYYNKEVSTLNNISFKVQSGDRIGVMGSTGAGKSTLINLITRFYDPTYGQILVDGINIKNYKLSDYRQQFGIVLQEPVLFSTTIAENIAYGLPNASTEEIIAAAKMANAHDFITKCSDGYNTLVGERGMNLSGGERQRISIARAFIKNAPILILDEPTSSLDVKTEAQIMEAMERLMQGRTTFLITHRLDTLNSCSIILHLEKGSLEEIIINNNSDTLAKKKTSFLSGNIIR